MTYRSERADVKVVKGCLEGAVLSPLLWCKLADSLLLKLNTVGYTSQAYADNLVLVTRSKYLSVVTYLMEGSLRIMDNLGKTKGPFINPQKTEIELFTRKKKTERIVTQISWCKTEPVKGDQICEHHL